MGMTYDSALNQTRIGFFIEWRRQATPEDVAEVTSWTDRLMGKPPEFRTEGKSDPCADNQNLEWLRTGKMPAPRRTN